MSDYHDPQYQIDTVQLHHGRVNLWGDVDEAQAQYVIDRMRHIFHNLRISKIHLYIHSDGGDTDACCAIIDEIVGLQCLGATIYTIAIGKAYSSGAMILSVGTERYATKHTSLMLHPVSIECPADYVAQQTQYTKYIEKHWQQIISFVAKKCGYNSKTKIADFESKIKNGLWMTVDEAIEFGLIDNIWDYKWEIEDDES